MSQDKLEQVCRCINQCKNCELCNSRRKPVCGIGKSSATIFFVGEAPGEQEDKTGLPFVGRCGRFLISKLREIGCEPTKCYITNAVKCRPPENRTPKTMEIELCQKWLYSQLDIIQPKIIVCIGRVAAQSVLRIPSTQSLQSVLSRWYDHWRNNIKVRAIYHPSYIMQHGRKYEDTMMTDLKEILAMERYLSGDNHVGRD